MIILEFLNSEVKYWFFFTVIAIEITVIWVMGGWCVLPY